VKTFSLPLREELKNRKLFRFSLFQLLRYRTYIGQFLFSPVDHAYQQPEQLRVVFYAEPVLQSRESLSHLSVEGHSYLDLAAFSHIIHKRLEYPLRSKSVLCEKMDILRINSQIL